MTQYLAIKWLFRLQLLFVAYCCLPQANADPVTLNTQFRQTNLGPMVQLMAESTEPLTLEQARALPDSNWAQTSAEVPSLGFTNTVYWVRVTLFNSNPNDVNLLLALEHPPLDHIEFYQLYGDRVVNQTLTGDSLPFIQRPLLHRNFLFPIHIDERHQTQIYLRVFSSSAIQLPLKLYDPAYYFAADQLYLLFQGAYGGLLLAAMLYCLVMLVASRDKIYISYIFYILGFDLAYLSLNGLGYQYLWPAWPRLNQCAVPFWVGFTALFASLLTSQLFNCRRHFPLWHRGLIRLGACGFGLLIGSLFIPDLLALELSVALALCLCFSLVVVSGILWHKYQQQDAFIFNLAWILLLAGIGFFALNRLGLIPRNALMDSAAQITSALQIILLTYVMAQRLTRDYKTRYEAEIDARTNNQRHFQAEHQHALELAKAVEEKTAALHDALFQVSKLNMDLARTSITDALTGLYNRRHFDTLLNTELKRAAREGRPISLILMDADHFKQVNDTYGHQVGDECLQQLATVITQALRKPPDHAFRYGGEELAILLPGTDLAGAIVVAEKVREMVDAAEFKFTDCILKLTLSLGVSSLEPDLDTLGSALFDPADQALYAAKHKGRNCVVAAKPAPAATLNEA